MKKLYAVVAAFLATFCVESLAETPTYNASTRTLDFPILNIGGAYYYGIQVKLDNFTLVRGATASGTCDPGTNLYLAAQPDFSCFPDQNAFDGALVGTWVSGNSDPSKISLTFSQASYGSGVFSTYTTPQTATAPSATYHNCKFSLTPNGSTPDIGFRPYSLETISCDEGSVPVLPGTSPPIADLLLINAYGGNNRIDRLVLSNSRAFGFSNVVLTKVGK